jgi:hypothetical protein
MLGFDLYTPAARASHIGSFVGPLGSDHSALARVQDQVRRPAILRL